MKVDKELPGNMEETSSTAVPLGFNIRRFAEELATSNRKSNKENELPQYYRSPAKLGLYFNITD